MSRGHVQMLRIRLALMLFIAALCLAACGAGDAAIPCADDPSCLIYVISADIPILDPHSADQPEAGMVFRQIYDTLVYRDAKTRDFVPGLAESWTISGDGRQYRFKLREDLRFHDGELFTARAVADNFARILDPERQASRSRRLLGPLSHSAVVDDFTLDLHLSEPYAPFLDALSQPFVSLASPRALESYGTLRYQFHQSGTGPFALVKYLPGDRIELRRNQRYQTLPPIYQSEVGGEIQRVVFQVRRETGESAADLLAGRVDVIDDLAPAQAINLGANSRVQLLPIPIPSQSMGFMFNTARPPLDQLELRRALIYATNRVEIVNGVAYNYSPIAWAPLSLSTGYAHTGYVNVFDHDLNRAQELLNAAGYSDSDGDGLLDRAGAPLALSVLIPPWGLFPQVAAYLREQWGRIGITLHIAPVPGKSRMLEQIQAGEHDLIAIDIDGVDPALLGQVFLGNSVYGPSRAAHDQLESLLLAARREQDPQARRSQYYEIQNLLMSEALILPIRDNVRLRAAGSAVSGLRYDLYGYYPLLYNVSLRP